MDTHRTTSRARGGATEPGTARQGRTRTVPPSTVARLPGYLRALHALAAEGAVLTSSDELAARAGVGSAQLRKDLSYLGSYGRRGVGYDVAHLAEQVEVVLGLTTQRRVVIVGIGNLGHALANYSGFADRGFAVVGLVDADPAVVGTTVAGLVVQPFDALPGLVRATGASIGVIATPAAGAQVVCDALVEAGVAGILTFAPAALAVPPHVDVRAVDVASELQILAFHDRRRTGTWEA
ncbi:redox-sensing transcriptional repressor Rex [Cellulomonas fimi]|uniref:Redox-sensing transcriptional repressor Rex n=1 Tax=Cellulomonas fimi (strain ATCC 484 / DSM 20113 / JCM 1341 / CCUG 24087 / LMG 16345 / NBRC 15513 / NCIMB 8980 / NCTC 7547 / NRS-133) TaxID=590998 RepID=F4H0S3_CELFA|nr:redox-sensing transcriptional repressor Rex [Cellulomonas fimi]AEE45046.1 CoA-binding domain protein [Cellulomonas fimi ATCC 484]NNH07978.1 redox-sensing transcriptional repressor Rex [Cellulomonas fimi]VEH28076.1 Redox-sensing transcriptional repressor rex [Cellulomonas fimi]